MSNEELRNAISHLAKWRAVEDAAVEVVQSKRKAFEASIAEEKSHLGGAKIIREKALRSVRELALETYDETGEESICTGISIRYNKVMDYKFNDAFDYALEDAQHLLKFDAPKFKKLWNSHKRAVKKALKAGADINPFPVDVEETDVITVVIATDLSAYLSDPE